MSYDSFIKSQLFKNKSSNLKKLGFNFDSDDKSEFTKIQSMLFSKYHIQNGSMLTIMKEFGIPSTKTMDILFKYFDIESRSLSQANTNALEQGRTSPPKNKKHISGWHKTWFDTEVYLRSSYEFNYAKFLDSQKIKYDTECFRIKYYDTQTNTFRIAIPDFYIPSSNTIVEIKSDYYLDVENMKNKKKEYKNLGFNFILLVDGEPREI